ncbi:MAG: phosphate signaling complex protein PhoU [Anaerolineae bacterium]|jgi:phosphate transport system protein|nr:phosphate signaling complex protein PhoU [Anaerolineae bacterium]
MTTRPLLDKELAKLREQLLELVRLADTAIAAAIEALLQQNIAAADAVIANDVHINELRYKIEKLCVTTIATQQPMASDLRAIIATAHVAVEIERMADHAAGIARLVAKLAEEPLLKPLIDIPRMAKIAREMLAETVNAFIAKDVPAAKTAAARDDEIDALYQQTLRDLLTYMMQDPHNIQRATYLLWVAHGLERIGDRVTNIAERVIFMETGKFEELE